MAQAQETLENTEVLTDRDDAEMDILNELNASPDDVTWLFRVTRVDGPAKSGLKEPFLFEGDSALMEGIHNRLRDQYGTGLYRVRVMKNRRLYRAFDIPIEAAPRAPAAPEARQSELAAVLQAVNESNARTIAVLERLAQHPAAPPPAPVAYDPVAQMRALGEMAKTLRELNPPPAPQADRTDLILKGFELATQLRDGAEPRGGDTSIMDIVRDLLKSPVIPALIAGANGPPRARPRIAPPAATPAAPPPSQTQATPSNAAPEPQAVQASADDAANMAQIKGALGYLLDKAKTNRDPGFYADWVADNWPGEMITSMLALPDLQAAMAQILPETAEHKEWFATLIDELKQIMVNASDDPNSAPETDAVGHASPIGLHRSGTDAGWGKGNASPNGGASEIRET